MDIGRLTPLPRLAPLESTGIAAPTQGGAAGGTFQQILGQVLGADASANARADQAIQALATGQTDDLHSVSLAVAEADLTFRMILELRNRTTEAFQEVLRMQV